MKKIYVITLTFAIILNCSAQNEEISWVKYNLKGKVKSLTETSYLAVEKFGEIQKGKRERENFWEFNFSLLFNNTGNLLEKTFYKMDGNIDSKCNFVYDKVGNLIEDNSCDSNGKLTFKTKYKYDTHNNQIELSLYESDGSLLFKRIFKYGDNKEIIEIKHYVSDGRLTNISTYKYDDKNNLIEIITLNNENGHSSKIFYKYNVKGLRTETKAIKENGDLNYKNTFRNDDKGNIIDLINFDKNDNPINESTYIYEYDENGNWIKSIISKNGVTKYIIEREITYF